MNNVVTLLLFFDWKWSLPLRIPSLADSSAGGVPSRRDAVISALLFALPEGEPILVLIGQYNAWDNGVLAYCGPGVLFWHSGVGPLAGPISGLWRPHFG